MATIAPLYHPPLPLDELLANARDIAAGASIPEEDEIYRRTVLARLSGACCDVADLTKHLDD